MREPYEGADQHYARRRISVGRVVLVSGVLLLSVLCCLRFLSARAGAEPVCTSTWTGPVAGNWQEATDWSTKEVPTSTTVACIGSGTTVEVSGGSNHAATIQGAGRLVVSGGTLTVTGSTTEAPSISTLEITGGTLTGSGRLNISSALTWSAGTMSGSGSTVLDSGATATLSGCDVALSERPLVNEGTMTLPSGSGLVMGEGARLENKGTFKANSQSQCEGDEATIQAREVSGKPNPVIVNTGTFEKTEGSEITWVQVPFENYGVVQTDNGILKFLGGGSGAAHSKWLAATGSA